MLFVYARSHRRQHLTVEDLFFGLLEDPTANATLLACGANVDELKSKITLFIDQHTPVADGQTDVDPRPTLGFQRVIQRAILRAMQIRKKHIEGSDCLIAIYGEKNSRAAYYLHQQSISRLDVVNFVLHGTRKDDAGTGQRVTDASDYSERSIGRAIRNFVADAAQSYASEIKQGFRTRMTWHEPGKNR